MKIKEELNKVRNVRMSSSVRDDFESKAVQTE